MAQIRFKGLPRRSNLGLVSATVGADSGSVNIASHLQPSAITGLPRISDGFDTDTLTVDTTGLTGTLTYDWREVGGATLATTATLTGTGHGGKYVECEVTCDQGVLVSPPVMIYSSTMMGEAMDPNHIVDDKAILVPVPHNDITHLAIAGGNWTAPETWYGGRVPRNGARVLIPNGIPVTYDEGSRYRLDWLRVDGDLTLALDQDTQLFVETLIGTRGSQIVMGTGAGRLPSQYTALITISGQDYRTTDIGLSDINLTRDPDLWGRGIIAQGVWRAWGAEKMMWSNADPIDVGATSATLHKVPTGWAVGDEIVISGTSVDYVQEVTNGPMTTYDEVRTITDITGSVVSWDENEPLIHPHKNQLTGSTRTDLYPKVMLKGCRNIKIHGEARDNAWQRGHTAHVHHSCTVDMWDVEFIGLGRTDKSTDVGKKDENGDFWYHDNSNGVTTDGFVYEMFTAQKNIASRYPMHMHHVGFVHMGARPIVHSCYVENSPGWCIAHHQCDVDLIECGMYDFWGAGMVAESGNELGGWINNIAGYSTSFVAGGTLYYNAKNREGQAGLTGNNFKGGYGFAYRGRAVRATGNIAFSCAWGHTFYHRAVNDMVFPIANLNRDYLDLKDVGLPTAASSGLGQFGVSRYPIIHFADNEALACLGGLHITKQGPTQFHDVNVKLKNFKAWGFLEAGADIEYIGVYILDKFDIVGQDNSQRGIQLNPNVMQLANVNARIEGCVEAREVNHQVTVNNIDATVFDNVNDPRFLEYGIDAVDSASDLLVLNDGVKAANLVTLTNDDFDGTAIDYNLTPSDTLPDVMADWDAGFSLSNVATNADGKKVTNIGSGMNISPKLWNDIIFADGGNDISTFAYSNEEAKGYWQTDVGNGTENFVVVQDIISDPLTGRPYRYRKLYRITVNPPGGLTLNGSFPYGGTHTDQANTLATVAEDGTIAIDVVTGATGGGGSTYTLVTGMNIKPDHGVATLDAGTGVVTYSPDKGYVGTDEMYVFVEGENKTSATVRIDVLIGAGGAVSAPTAPIVTDHADANTIGVQLLAPPSTGGRRIDLVQYSTDSGATWRRLTHGWVQAVHKVTVESDGTAISAGSYDVRIRYKTNYDYTVSAATADDAVTVT